MSLLEPRERTQRGLALQSELTGRTAAEPATLWQETWRDFIYAEVWSRPGLDRRARFLISLAASASNNGAPETIDNYVRGALTTGELSLAELREAALHVAVYCGWDKGGDLDAAITRVQDALGLDPVTLAPVRADPWDPQVRMEQGFAAFTDVMTFDGPPVGNGTPFLQDGILNFVFGEMWCRPGLDQRSRRFLTLVGVANSAAVIPIGSHFHAAMASGNCTAAELHEFVLQYAIHASWPRASVVQGVVFEQAAKIEKGLAWNG
ncbi:carboxymuconolactone decarboxylase family protein [Novosphingobium sp. 9U]|uniref:carboxymuconolactone decarboxylase family protein n=1 Tax=Novosphingobium sp. 9U TaxID=2653158 RepID=UPI0012F43D2E|nr:carboxymuconolactone decarboxylase family protein [Novosphingobium sp. 9U]VWX46729.1 Gamma-carboxymuconolactone decarboxylase [Novosphingobium sp. 9U]